MHITKSAGCHLLFFILCDGLNGDFVSVPLSETSKDDRSNEIESGYAYDTAMAAARSRGLDPIAAYDVEGGELKNLSDLVQKAKEIAVEHGYEVD